MGLWWKDALVPEQANWLHFDGQPGAIESWTAWPPRHWRFQWSWFILEAVVPTGTPSRLRCYFKSGAVCREYRWAVRTPFVGVRVGPWATEFSALGLAGAPVELRLRAGQLSWMAADLIDNESMARSANLPYFRGVTFL
jgi:hypothetical protein